jgi:uncharacterized protein
VYPYRFIRLFFLLFITFYSGVSLSEIKRLPGVYVYDTATIFSDFQSRQLQFKIEEIFKKTTVEVGLVTIPKLQVSIEDDAEKIFNSIKLGDRNLHNGLLILVAPNDRRIRLEVGYGLEPLFTPSVSGDLLAINTTPYFKSSQFYEGCSELLKEIESILVANPKTALGFVDSAPKFLLTKRKKAAVQAWVLSGIGVISIIITFFLRRKRSISLAHFLPLIILIISGGSYVTLTHPYKAFGQELLPLIVALGVSTLSLFWLSISFYRFGPRKCKDCGNELELLSDLQEGKFLDESQKLEEKIGAREYDVWQCSACTKIAIESYSELCSHKKCAVCQAQAVKIVSSTMVSTSLFGNRKRLVKSKCLSCGDETSWLETISNSSSGSSSFGGSSSSSGGGGSGGGGASASW